MKLMLSKIRVTGLACALTLLVLAPVQAADIDLFTTADGKSSPPNVYVMIDNSANWNAKAGGTLTKREMEHAALKAVFADDPDIAGTVGSTTDPIKINVGFGVFAKGNSPKGGKVMKAIAPLDSTYQSELEALLYDGSGNENLPGTNNAPYGLSFNEAIAYFAGEAPVAGTQDGDHDPDAIESGTYKIPVETNTCGKNYVIMIGNGEPDSGEDTDAENKLAARGGVLAGDPIEVDPSNYESNWSDEYARFMAGSDIVPDTVRGDFQRNVRTYVIDVYDTDKKLTPPEQAARSWMKSIAKWGDGRYFTAKTESDVAAALQAILDELFAVDSVFAASTLPVSVNVRGTNLNQVYMGVFRPSATDQTRWPGNLKLYQLAVDEATNTLFLADANGDPAQSSTTGFLVHDAESFWTHSSSYWDFDPRGEPPTGSDLPDGAVVEKGGTHQQLRDLYAAGTSGRPLYTRTSGACTVLSGTSGRGCAMDDFDTSNAAVDQTSLGTASATEAQELVDWMHGANNNTTDTTDPDTKTTKTPRPSVHGDVLHSRPAVINYGDRDADGESEVYAFYGSNDGIFHAIRGGKTNTGAGEEIWGFIPEEFFGRLKALRDRDSGKEYFADGGIGVFQEDNDGDGVIETGDGDRVYLYVGMRRGGRLLYALNVSDPENPEFMWKISDSTAGFAELGQTWSQPDVHEIRYVDGTGTTITDEVLIFGGGYDPAAEDPGATAATTMGRAIYVVDAEDGSLLWSASAGATDTPDETVADMDWSIPSDVTVVDSDGNGFADRVYVGDTGGQVWRVDISGMPTDWDINKLATIGEAAGLEERKFLFPPDVVFTDKGFDAVLIGSGNRADPFRTSVTNRFYMFKDTTTGLDVSPSWKPIEEGDMFNATDNLIQVGDETQQSTAQSALDSSRGWYVSLVAGGTGTGEKVVSSAVTLGGAVFFNTNEPPDDSATCGQSLGIARFYEIDFLTGAAILENNNVEGLQTDDRYSEAAGGGFPPSPVPVIVEIDGQKYQSVISGTETQEPPGAEIERRTPVYWNT
ncbi:MAG: PilC/PilY family type IV pilus protein, partial [Halofilum sp. (in: g-proteobacteria)]|nr:PilC/PilY family type IV pilus protein [Halofilum sp. (in: g-proteobacteria)]